MSEGEAFAYRQVSACVRHFQTSGISGGSAWSHGRRGAVSSGSRRPVDDLDLDQDRVGTETATCGVIDPTGSVGKIYKQDERHMGKTWEQFHSRQISKQDHRVLGGFKYPSRRESYGRDSTHQTEREVPRFIVDNSSLKKGTREYVLNKRLHVRRSVRDSPEDDGRPLLEHEGDFLGGQRQQGAADPQVAPAWQRSTTGSQDGIGASIPDYFSRLPLHRPVTEHRPTDEEWRASLGIKDALLQCQSLEELEEIVQPSQFSFNESNFQVALNRLLVRFGSQRAPLSVKFPQMLLCCMD